MSGSMERCAEASLSSRGVVLGSFNLISLAMGSHRRFCRKGVIYFLEQAFLWHFLSHTPSTVGRSGVVILFSRPYPHLPLEACIPRPWHFWWAEQLLTRPEPLHRDWDGVGGGTDKGGCNRNGNRTALERRTLPQPTRTQRPSGIPVISSRAEVPLSTNQVLLPEHSKGGGINVGIHFLTLHYHESTW